MCSVARPQWGSIKLENREAPSRKLKNEIQVSWREWILVTANKYRLLPITTHATSHSGYNMIFHFSIILLFYLSQHHLQSLCIWAACLISKVCMPSFSIHIPDQEDCCIILDLRFLFWRAFHKGYVRQRRTKAVVLANSNVLVSLWRLSLIF